LSASERISSAVAILPSMLPRVGGERPIRQAVVIRFA